MGQPALAADVSFDISTTYLANIWEKYYTVHRVIKAETIINELFHSTWVQLVKFKDVMLFFVWQ